MTPTHPTTPPTPPVVPDALGAVVRERVLRLVEELGQGHVEGLHPLILREVERSLLETILEVTQGHRGEAARVAGLHRNSLRLRLRALGLDDGSGS